MDWRNHITSDENILLGKPIIKNTRISVELIMELFENGWTEQSILESYTHLTKDDIKAVFAFAKESLNKQLLFALPKSA